MRSMRSRMILAVGLLVTQYGMDEQIAVLLVKDLTERENLQALEPDWIAGPDWIAREVWAGCQSLGAQYHVTQIRDHDSAIQGCKAGNRMHLAQRGPV